LLALLTWWAAVTGLSGCAALLDTGVSPAQAAFAQADLAEEVQQQAEWERPLTDQEKVQQDKTVAAIQKRGGRVSVDENRPDKAVVKVFLGGPNYTTSVFSDDDLQLLHGLPRLHTIVFGRSRVTDEGLKHLQGLRHLQVVWFPLNGTDAGLKHLKGLANLRELYVGNNTSITDAGLEHLKRLTQLRILNLNHTKVGDAGLNYLQGLIRLEQLYLTGTRVTDAGLVHLRGLTQLKTLDLAGTKVTRQGAAELRQVLPNATITRHTKGGGT
jgi:Leucine-rich repeat (LRR) protein